MPGEFYVETAKIPTLDRYLADSAVEAAMPPGKDFLAGSDSASLQGKWYRTYYVVDNKAIATGEHLIDARPNQNTTDERSSNSRWTTSAVAAFDQRLESTLATTWRSSSMTA